MDLEFEWDPRKAQANLSKHAVSFDEGRTVFGDPRAVTITSWEPEHRVFTVAPGPPGEARVQTFYYPLWVAKAGNQSLATRPAKDGALLVTVPPDKTVVTLNFREPARVQKVRVVSWAAWLIIMALCIHGLRQAGRHKLLPNS